MLKLRSWADHRPTRSDAVFLIVAVVWITLRPFYLYGNINFLEASLYLPGIDAIFKGEIPYYDFFHLRGPLELYFQAFWMCILGKNYFVLPTYFYAGAITTMVIFILIAKELLQTRSFLYAMSLSFIARTFPRVSLTIGGGFRQAWGALAIYFIIRYFKDRKGLSLWLAGIFSAVGLMTSVEIGVYSFAGILMVLCVDWWDTRRKGFFLPPRSSYIVGAGFVLIPVAVFMQIHQALIPMLDTYYQVPRNLFKTFPQTDPMPRTVLEVLTIMFNPLHVNFKHMTPLFCYLGIVIYLVYLYRRGERHYGVLSLAVYGLLTFIGSMRGLWGPAFENALQPEKVLLFFLLERSWFWLKENKQQYRRIIAASLSAGVFLSTVLYALPRFQKRFDFIRIIFSTEKSLASVFPFSERDLVVLDFPRMQRMVVPQEQAQDMLQLYRFFNIHTALTDKVVFFPDFGVYNFIVDRPFVGRFPVVTLSWIGRGWHEEFMRAFEKENPPYVVTYKKLPDYFPATQLVLPETRRKYEEVLAHIHEHYRIVSGTPSFHIWQRRI